MRVPPSSPSHWWPFFGIETYGKAGASLKNVGGLVWRFGSNPANTWCVCAMDHVFGKMFLVYVYVCIHLIHFISISISYILYVYPHLYLYIYTYLLYKYMNGNISKLGILKRNPTQPGCTSRCSKHPLQAGRWEQVHVDGSCQCSVSHVLHIYT